MLSCRIVFLIPQVVGQFRLQRSLQDAFVSCFSRPFSPMMSSGFLYPASIWSISALSIAIGADSPLPMVGYTVPYTAPSGFHNVACALGTHLNADQFRQLCEGPHTVYLAFDVDANQSGQQAAEQLAHRLGAHGVSTRRVLLPPGHDPNSFFVEGGDAPQFHSLLEAAQP